MISVEQLLYKIDLKLNKVASGKFQNISTPDKILALNEAQIRLIKQKINLNNLYQAGFDAFKSRYEDLQVLVVPYEELEPKKTKESLTSYQVSLDSLKKEYFLPVDILVLADKGVCKNRILNIPRITRHSELVSMLNNPHFQPSFLYQETIGIISSNKLIVYTKDDFIPRKVQISYLRYPRKMDYAGPENDQPYVHLDGSLSTRVDCELSPHLEDELLELAVYELAINTGNAAAAQGSIAKAKNSE